MLPDGRTVHGNYFESMGISSRSSSESAVKSLIGLTSQSRIFTDHDSPFHTAPEIVKQILLKARDTNQCLNCNDIDLTPLQFIPKITQNNKCLHMFKSDLQKFYLCLDCTGQNQKIEGVILCQNCFQPENHVGHQYYTEICREMECICSCGFQEKFSRKFMCRHHGEDKNVEVEIDEKQRQYFLSIFMSLLQVACYLNEREQIFKIICMKLVELCQNSLYYCQLTLELLKKQSNFELEPDGVNSKCFLTILIEDSSEINLVIVCLCANKDIQLELALFIIKNYQQFFPYQHQTSLQIYTLDIIFSYSTLQKILQQQKIPNLLLFNRYQQFMRKKRYRKTSQKLFTNYIKKLMQIVSDDYQHYFLAQLIESQYVIANSQMGWLCLKYCIENYPAYKKQLACEIIMRSIIVVTRADQKRISNFRDQLKDEGVELWKFEAILEQIVYNSRDYIYNKRSSLGNQTPISMITLLLLIKSSENRQQYIDIFWKSLLEQDNQFVEIVAQIYSIVSAVIWSETHLVILDNIISKISLDQVPKSGRQKQMNNFYVRFLGLKQQIKRSQLISMFQQHIIQPSQIGKILTDLCAYRKQGELFTYTSTPLQHKFEDKFFFCLRISQSRSIVISMYENDHIFYGFEDQLATGIRSLQNYQRELLQYMMGSVVIDILDASFSPQRLNNMECKCTYLYIFTIILIHGFIAKDKKPSIKNQLQRIKVSVLKQDINQYAGDQVEMRLNLRLFGVKQDDVAKDNMRELVQMIKSQNHSQYRMKGKRIIKTKKHQLRILDAPNQQNQIKKDEDIDEQKCLICLKKYNQNEDEDDLVYLASIKVDSSIYRAIYSQEDKANIMINTCFHLLHVSCFIEQHKNSNKNNFSCPSCQKDTNCFLVRDFRKINKRTKLVFQNVLVSALIYESEIYNIENSFMMLYRSLVQMKGLKPLFSNFSDPSQDEIKDKNDNFVMELMMAIYEVAEVGEQQSYRRDIEKFTNGLSECKNEAIKLVQMLISQTLKQKILHKEKPKFNIHEFKRLRNLLKTEQFTQIKSAAESIMQQKLNLPRQQKTSQQPKPSLKLTFAQIPTDSTQFPKFLIKNLCSRNHERKIDYFCLICGKGVCQQCNDQKQQLVHYGIKAYLCVERYTLYLQNLKMRIQTNIYYNELKVGYSERQASLMPDQAYKLDWEKYTSMTQRFVG